MRTTSAKRTFVILAVAGLCFAASRPRSGGALVTVDRAYGDEGTCAADADSGWRSNFAYCSWDDFLRLLVVSEGQDPSYRHKLGGAHEIEHGYFMSTRGNIGQICVNRGGEHFRVKCAGQYLDCSDQIPYSEDCARHDQCAPGILQCTIAMFECCRGSFVPAPAYVSPPRKREPPRALEFRPIPEPPAIQQDIKPEIDFPGPTSPETVPAPASIPIAPSAPEIIPVPEPPRDSERDRATTADTVADLAEKALSSDQRPSLSESAGHLDVSQWLENTAIPAVVDQLTEPLHDSLLQRGIRAVLGSLSRTDIDRGTALRELMSGWATGAAVDLLHEQSIRLGTVQTGDPVEDIFARYFSAAQPYNWSFGPFQYLKTTNDEGIDAVGRGIGLMTGSDQ